MHSRPEFKKNNHTPHLLPLPHLRIPHSHLLELLPSAGDAILLMALAQLVLQSTPPLPFEYIAFQKLPNLAKLSHHYHVLSITHIQSTTAFLIDYHVKVVPSQQHL